MKLVALSKGYVAKVDDEDYERIIQHKWHAHEAYKTVYGRSWLGKDASRSDVRSISLQNFILGLAHNSLVDHKDRDGLNCQKYNLRAATSNQNAQNKTNLQGANGSGFRGVSYTHGGRYIRAQIRRPDGIREFLGNYKTEEEAAKAYDTAAIKYHGEFAQLNFPLEK